MHGHDKLICNALCLNMNEDQARYHYIMKKPTGYELSKAVITGYDYLRCTLPCRIGGRPTPVHFHGNGDFYEAVKDKRYYLLSMFTPLQKMCEGGIEDWITRDSYGNLSYTQYGIDINALMTAHYKKVIMQIADCNFVRVVGWVDGENILVEVFDECPVSHSNQGMPVLPG